VLGPAYAAVPAGGAFSEASLRGRLFGERGTLYVPCSHADEVPMGLCDCDCGFQAVLDVVQHASLDHGVKLMRSWVGPLVEHVLQVHVTVTWAELAVGFNHARLNAVIRKQKWRLPPTPAPQLLTDIKMLLMREPQDT